MTSRRTQPSSVHPLTSDNLEYCALYLAEPALATKAFDERAMYGLGFFLQENGLTEKIQEVDVIGGVIPHVPPFSSKQYSNDLRFLGKIDVQEGEASESQKLLEERLKTPYEEQFFAKYVNDGQTRKIENLDEAFYVAGRQLGLLMDYLPDEVRIRIQAGEEDMKNIGHLEREKLKENAKVKKKQIKEIIDEVKAGITSCDRNALVPELKLYGDNSVLDNDILVRNPEETRPQYLARLTETFAPRVEKTVSSYNEHVKKNSRLKAKDANGLLSTVVNHVVWAAERGKLEDEVSKFESTLHDLEEKKEAYTNRLSSLAHDLNWSEDLMEGFFKNVAMFTGQFPVSPVESEIFWASSKSEYTLKFHEWDLSQQILVHISGRGERSSGEEVILDNAGKKNISNPGEGKRVFITHNLNGFSSDAAGVRAVRDGKDYVNAVNTLMKRKEGKFPDYFILGGHDGGGFRVMPWHQRTEAPEEGNFVSGLKTSYLISLPTFQSVENLELLTNKNFRGWHIKRFNNGPFASAATIHTADSEGVNRFIEIDQTRAIEVANIVDQIGVYTAAIKDKTTVKGVKTKLRKEIQQLRESVKVDLEKLENNGDTHNGAPANRDRYSSDQLITAGQIYQREHGLPGIVSMDEIIHGAQIFYGAESDYQADIAPKMLKHLATIEARKDLTDNEKIQEMKKYSVANLRSLPVFNTSNQKEYFKYLIKPYLDEVLENKGQVIFTSGNHHNRSHREADEALELANMFSTEQTESGQVKTFQGKANDIGLGYLTLPSGHRLYVAHKFPTRSDEIFGIMSQLRKMNNDADIVLGGDRHQTGIGYADNHFVALHPAWQSQNKFVSSIGMPAGVRGFQNVFFDKKSKGVYAGEFVIDETLEKIIEERDII